MFWVLLRRVFVWLFVATCNFFSPAHSTVFRDVLQRELANFESIQTFLDNSSSF